MAPAAPAPAPVAAAQPPAYVAPAPVPVALPAPAPQPAPGVTAAPPLPYAPYSEAEITSFRVNARPQPDGSFYRGSIGSKGFEGFGILLSSDGRERYEGEFRHGEKDGRGVYVYGNGDMLDGTFEDDAPDGPGVFRFANGGVVNGTWVHGRFWSGSGTLVTETGTRLSASWEKGELVATVPLQ